MSWRPETPSEWLLIALWAIAGLVMLHNIVAGIWWGLS
jgi:hypothetical protein